VIDQSALPALAVFRLTLGFSKLTPFSIQAGSD
jgi:hypothetical protein